MSDRKRAIETLKQLRLDYEEFYEEHNNEVTHAYDMAIASLEVDEAYQLEYETTTKNDLGVDAVSREKAIKWAKFYTDIYDAEVANKEIMKMLKDLPSVTPQEPKTGHWTEEFNDLEGEVRFTCSSCGKYQLFETDFCYHCGSDNREVVEE